MATAPTAIRTSWQDRQCGLQIRPNIVEETVTAGAPEISAIVEDLFSMDAMHDMHDIYRIRGDDAEFQRRITKLMDSVACLGADTRTRPGAHEPVSLQV